MKLMASQDLGKNYYPILIGELWDVKDLALTLDRKGECRWVLVDENDEPKYWCAYIEQQVSIEKGAVIATQDKYVTKIAHRKGLRTLTLEQVLKCLNLDFKKEIKKELDFDDFKKSVKKIDEYVKKGHLKELPNNLDESKIGKELFGE